MGDRFVLVLRFGVVTAHQALQLGEFADHLGEQVGLAELRRALGLGDVGADHGRKLSGERDDAGDALGLAAELFMKHDVLEFRQTLFELGLEIGLVKELGVRQARADDALVAGDDRLAAIGRLDIGDQDELVDQLAGRRIAHHEALLVGADGRTDDFAGDVEEVFIK